MREETCVSMEATGTSRATLRAAISERVVPPEACPRVDHAWAA